MDVSDVKVTDEDGLTNLTLAPDLHFQFYQRTVTDEIQSLCIDVASKYSQEVDHNREEN